MLRQAGKMRRRGESATGNRTLWIALKCAADGQVRLGLALAAVLAVMAAALAALAPLALKWLIDHGTSAPDAIIGATAILAVYLGLVAGGRLLVQIQSYVFALADQRLQARLTTAQFDRLVRLPLTFHLGHQRGRLLQTHALGLQGVRILLSLGGFTLLPAVVQLIAVLSVVASLFNAAIWLVVAASVIAYGVIFAWTIRRISDPAAAALAGQVEAAGLLHDRLSNVESIKNCTAERSVAAAYGAIIGATEKRWRQYFLLRLQSDAALAVIFAIGLGAAMGLGLLDLSRGAVSIGDLVLLNIYMLQIIAPLESGGVALRELAHGMVYLSGWRETFHAQEEVERSEGPNREVRSCSAWRRAPALEFRDVCFSYGSTRQLLKEVTFRIEAGSIAAIVGPSGAGKSTLSRLLNRHLVPSSGEILIGGQAIEEIDLCLLRGAIATVAQDTRLFDDTLLFNLSFGRPDASTGEVESATAAAHLDPVIARLPDGLSTRVGDNGATLSGGERQRVLIARALLQQKPLLFLDEPTSALDARNEDALARTLKSAASGRTTLIVTHRLGLAAAADTILVLDEGRITERGSHDELLRLGGAYARMWRSQSEQHGDRQTLAIED